VRILWCDTETGGLNPETDALLSVGLVDYQDGKILRSEEVLIDASGLVCDPKALAVNHIDLDLHHAYSGLLRTDGATLRRGHNVFFDVGFIRRLFAPDVLRKMVSHRMLDTCKCWVPGSIRAAFPDGIGKLDQAMAHFGLTMPEGKRHTALGDALVTAELYTRLLQTIAKSGGLMVAEWESRASWVAERVRSIEPDVSLRDYQDDAVTYVAHAVAGAASARHGRAPDRRRQDGRLRGTGVTRGSRTTWGGCWCWPTATS
jgi:DNA polymerase III epsilon subunit-like protein